MEKNREWVTIIFEPADDDDIFLKMFEEGYPIGDIFWKVHGEILEPDPETGYQDLYSSPISQLGIPEELLIKHGLLGW